MINDHGRVVKNISGGKPQGRMTGRPRLRWLEDVAKDHREMKVKRWRQKAVNREELAFVIKKGQAISKQRLAVVSEGPYNLINCNYFRFN